MKDVDKQLETPSQRAARRWHNHEIASVWKEFQIEERERAAREAENQPPRVASVIENDKIIEGRITKVQTKFAQEIRAMLEEHKRRNLLMYRLSLRMRIHRLKEEVKRRRAEQKRDLFS